MAWKRMLFAIGCGLAVILALASVSKAATTSLVLGTSSTNATARLNGSAGGYCIAYWKGASPADYTHILSVASSDSNSSGVQDGGWPKTWAAYKAHAIWGQTEMDVLIDSSTLDADAARWVADQNAGGTIWAAYLASLGGPPFTGISTASWSSYYDANSFTSGTLIARIAGQPTVRFKTAGGFDQTIVFNTAGTLVISMTGYRTASWVSSPKTWGQVKASSSWDSVLQSGFYGVTRDAAGEKWIGDIDGAGLLWKAYSQTATLSADGWLAYFNGGGVGGDGASTHLPSGYPYSFVLGMPHGYGNVTFNWVDSRLRYEDLGSYPNKFTFQSPSWVNAGYSTKVLLGYRLYNGNAGSVNTIDLGASSTIGGLSWATRGITYGGRSAGVPPGLPRTKSWLHPVTGVALNLEWDDAQHGYVASGGYKLYWDYPYYDAAGWYLNQ